MTRLHFAVGFHGLVVFCFLGATAPAGQLPDGKADQPAEYWLKQLTSTDPKERARASRELGAFLDKETVVAGLIEATADPTPLVRREAVLALAGRKFADNKLLAALRKAAKDTEARVRLAAQGMLWKHTRAEAALAPLLEALKDPSPDVRREAVHSLGLLVHDKKAVAAVVPVLLSDPDHEVRAEAALAVNVLCHRLRGEAREAVPALVELLGAEDDFLRERAFGALGEIGREARAAIPHVIQALRKRQGMAAWALGRIGSDGKTVVPALVEALGDADFASRREAAYALARIGPDAKPAAPELLRAAEDKKANVRVAARLALWRATGEEKQLRLAITEAAEGGELANAFTFLVTLGPTGQAVLVDSLKHSSAKVREMAVLSLGTADEPLPKQTVPALSEAVKDPDPKVQEAAARLLRSIDPEAARKAGIP